MSNTPSNVVTAQEMDAATNTAKAIRFGDVGVTSALLDAGTDHEQRVIVLTVDVPGEPENEAPVAVILQGLDNHNLYDRLTPPTEACVFESAEGVA